VNPTTRTADSIDVDAAAPDRREIDLGEIRDPIVDENQKTIASLEARVTAALATATDASDLATATDSPSRLLYWDRRERLERFADQQLRTIHDVCQQIRVGDSPSAEQLHQHFVHSFTRSRTDGYAADWQLAAYPLAVAIDECLLEHFWPGQRWWENHVLESTLFGTRVGSQRFFEMANQLKLRRCHPMGPTLLRIHHECVAVGFQGLYATAAPVTLAEPLGLPASLSQWRIELHRTMVQWAQEMAAPPLPDAAQRRNIAGAPPLRHHRVTWILGASCVVILAVNALIWAGMGH